MTWVGRLVVWAGTALILIGSAHDGGQAAGSSQYAIPLDQLKTVERAALLGDATAAHRLAGYDLLCGNSERGREEAFWTEIAAQNGHPTSQYNLGCRLSYSRSPRDVLRSRFWLEKARANGNASAKKLLAAMDRGEWPLPTAVLDSVEAPPE
jgi:TPR repeat protein